MLEFLVVGKPEPQGSTQAFVPVHPKTKQPYRRPGGGIVVNVTSDNPKLKAWRERVKIAADTSAWIDDPVEGPVRVEVDFYLERPKGHMGTGRNAGAVRASAPPLPVVRPDVDKLLRGVLDALTGLAWVDDSQVVEVAVRKRYAAPGESQGARVLVAPVDVESEPDEPAELTLAI